MVLIEKVKEKIQENRFREYRYQEPFPDVPMQSLDSLEKIRNFVPGLDYFDEFEKDWGGNLFFIEYSLTIASDECNDTITYENAFSGIYSVSFTFYRRKFECRLEESPPEEILTSYVDEPKPAVQCSGFGRALYIINRYESLYYEDFLILHNEIAGGYTHTKTATEITDYSFPPNEYTPRDQYGFRKQVYARVKYKFTVKQLITKEFLLRSGFPEDTPLQNYSEEYEAILYVGDNYVYAGGLIIHYKYDQYLNNSRILGYSSRTVSSQAIIEVPYSTSITVGSDDEPIDGTLETPIRTIQISFLREVPDAFGNRIFVYQPNIDKELRINEVKVEHYGYCQGGTNYEPPEKVEKKNPPPPKKMKCCPDYTPWLKAIYIKVKQNNEAIGYSDYPVSVPTSLISVDDKEPENKEINSLTQFLGWYVERFDEVVGQFEIPINVEDIDLIKEGNQSLKVKLPNIAEAVAEMFMMLINLTISNEIQLNIATRTLAETGSDKQQNFKSYKMLDAIVEYLGFKFKDKVEKLPLTFTPGEDELAKILKEKEVDVSCVEYDDKVNLPKQMYELLHAASIIRAVHWNKIDTKKDVKGQLLDKILSAAGLIDNFAGKLDIEQLEKELNQIQDEGEKP